MAAIATQMEHLGVMTAFAQKAIDDRKLLEVPSDYRALVCVFFAGGNDGNNMVIPNHGDATVSNYTAYSNARAAQGLAIAQNQLLPISVPRLGGLTYGLNPSLGPQTPNGTTIVNNGVHELWAQGKLAVVTNVGTLVRPMLRSQYQNGSVQKPYQLFSHSDQVAQAQTSVSNTQSFTGWGGRASDNMTQPNNPNGLIPMITSISGAQLFTAGQSTLPLAIADSNTLLANVLNPAGFTNTGGAARLTAFNALRSQELSSNYIAAASHITDLAMQANGALQTPGEVTVTFPATSIGRQLKQVARLIKKRSDLSINRQIFYVQLGSFDTHTNQLTGQNNLLTQFSQAARAFWDEMVTQGIQDGVTLFSLSDFGRTFNPAGTGASVGSDHAWGNHMFVLGGSVSGGDFYGSLRPDGTGNYYPTLTQGGPDDTDGGTAPRGRWIPTTSVDQYASVLAKWFGLPQDTQTLNRVFPNLGNFPASPGLNFLP
jgi:uncharacterized protein (DUF1501 family)